MKRQWERFPLEDVVFFQEGPGIRSYEYQKDGYPMINVRCVQDGYIDLSTCNAANIQLALGKWRHFQVDEGDILFTISGSIGRTALVRKEHLPLLMNTSVVRFRSKTELLRDDFFYYYLQSWGFLSKLHLLSSGTAQKNVGPTHLKTMDVPVPPLADQLRIVGILDEAFEGIATAKTNAEKNLQNTRALFESHLQSVFGSHRGKWTHQGLEQVSKVFGRGKSRHRPRNERKLFGGDFPFIQTGDVRNADGVIESYSQTYSDFGLAQSKLWPKGTVCITIAANIAESAILGFDACFPDSIIGVVVDDELTSNKFLLYLLRSYKSLLQAKGKGSAQDNINLGTFEGLTFPFPPLKIQHAIAEQLECLRKETQQLASNCQRKLAFLDELKESLLCQAFNGQL